MAEQEVDRLFYQGPQIPQVPFRISEFRGFFPTEMEFREAMKRAEFLERRNCPRRAWRVRLGLDKR